MAKITLSDGTVLNNLEKNCSYYISSVTLTEADFEGKLSSVAIDDAENSGTLTDCYLYSLEQKDNKTWFVLGEKTEAMKQAELNADIELALTELYELIIGG